MYPTTGTPWPRSVSRLSNQTEVFHLEDADPGPVVPERLLLVAVLRRAIYDFVLYRELTHNEKYNELYQDAASWLFWDGRETTDDLGRWTYRYVCSALELNYRAIRKRSLQLTREDLKRLSVVRED